MPDPVPALWIRFRGWPVSDGFPSQNVQAAILESWRRIANRSGLIESHAESKFFTPNDVARQMQSIVQHNQCEFRRDADLVGHLEGGSGNRKVANRTINSDSAKLNLGDFPDAIARCNPSFDHSTSPNGSRNLSPSPGSSGPDERRNSRHNYFCPRNTGR
jgi:hypothetical protein